MNQQSPRSDHHRGVPATFSEGASARPMRRRTLAGLTAALPVSAVLGAAAQAAPPDPHPGGGKGPGRGKGRGRKDPFRLGVENLMAERLDLLAGASVGLITNPTGTDSALRSTIDLLVDAQDAAGFRLTALYGPEHGVRGSVPAGGYVEDYTDEKTGLPVRSLYGKTQKPTPEMLEDIDVLVFDIQDIGARFYTYIWTLYYAMEAAEENGKRFVVLDRPNPLGRQAEGFVLEDGLSSFVGLTAIPQRHGLTVGELALYFADEFLGGDLDLSVVPMSGYDPRTPQKVDSPWVLPSPNIPTRETAIVYAGTGLLESLNVSEGRGTTTPFLWFGAPFITEAHADQIIQDLSVLPGILLRPMSATPTTSKHVGEFCGGVQIHLVDEEAIEPVRLGIHLIATLLRRVEETDWREGEKCRTAEDTCWIDNLTGTRRIRQMLEDGAEPDAIVDAWKKELKDFTRRARAHHLY